MAGGNCGSCISSSGGKPPPPPRCIIHTLITCIYSYVFYLSFLLVSGWWILGSAEICLVTCLVTCLGTRLKTRLASDSLGEFGERVGLILVGFPRCSGTVPAPFQL